MGNFYSATHSYGSGKAHTIFPHISCKYEAPKPKMKLKPKERPKAKSWDIEVRELLLDFGLGEIIVDSIIYDVKEKALSTDSNNTLYERARMLGMDAFDKKYSRRTA